MACERVLTPGTPGVPTRWIGMAGRAQHGTIAQQMRLVFLVVTSQDIGIDQGAGQSGGMTEIAANLP